MKPIWIINLTFVGLGAASLAVSHARLKQVLSIPTKVVVGKNIFFDKNLSNPKGMSCSSCHDPSAGFSYPESVDNFTMGPVEGVVPNRFGNRLPPSTSYVALSPPGPPHFSKELGEYVGGYFWDGRADTPVSQAGMPFQNPNEMNNTIHNTGDPARVVAMVKSSSYAPLFKSVYGQYVFNQTTDKIYLDIEDAIVAYEKSPEMSPFNSKYDAYLAGKVNLTADELDGLRIFTGTINGRPGGKPYKVNAQCSTCHGIPATPGAGPDIFTNACYANNGAPKNPNNPYYTETDKKSNPMGYNPDGVNFIDLGLGDYFYPAMGRAAGDPQHGDPYDINGTFKAPPLRNVDKRPYAAFVKAYYHNGFFKSLDQVVHFYNTRNLTTQPGEVIDFTKARPYQGLKGRPLWPQPEYASPKTMQNPKGLKNGPEAAVGNLGLTLQQEQHLVAFMKTLSDGYSSSNRNP